MAVRSRVALISAGLIVLAACASFSSSAEGPADGGGLDGGLPDVPDDSALPLGDAGASRYAAAVLADQPIAYWRMGATSGFTIPNEVGDGGNALVLQGSVRLGAMGALPNESDTAVRFDGLTKGYAEAQDPAPFEFTKGAPFTIEWWARHEPVDGGARFQEMVAAAAGAAPATNGYLVYWVDDIQVQAELDAPDAATVLTTVPVSTTGWKHYALVFDGTMVSLVIDGTMAATQAAKGKLSARQSAFVVGAASGATPTAIGGNGFAGLIDEVAVYYKALTHTQLNSHIAAR